MLSSVLSWDLSLHNGLYLSHLMYDDAENFIGEWSEIKVINHNRLLHCFFLSRRKFYGVSVSDHDVSRLGSILKSKPASFLFTYHGLHVGANIKLSKHWNPVNDESQNKLI